MKKFFLSLSIFFIFFINFSLSQESLIEITNTNINVPDTYDFGEVIHNEHTKFIIKNSRSSAIVVSEIETPPGFFANISDMNIGAGKKVILYVGLKPEFIDDTGSFLEEIKIKTNLVMDIVIKVKGKIVKQE